MIPLGVHRAKTKEYENLFRASLPTQRFSTIRSRSAARQANEKHPLPTPEQKRSPEHDN